MSRQRTYEVRVIAGELKGRKLRYPRDADLRPTMQRTKASVFDALGEAVRGAGFLDLYAGAGAIGVEACSRGAAYVVFVEHSRSTLPFLRENAALCDPAKVEIHAGDVLEFLRRRRPRAGAREIVFADPPYAADAGLLLEFYERIDYALPELLIVEHPTQLDFSVGRLAVLRSRAYGQTKVTFFTAA